jgi:hypothetical protein
MFLFKVVTNLKFYKDHLQKHFYIIGWCLMRMLPMGVGGWHGSFFCTVEKNMDESEKGKQTPPLPPPPHKKSLG